MQTFLPYQDFKKSAQCLDYKRLGKQRVEAWQIFNTIEKKNQGIDTIITSTGKIRKLGWTNHPAVLMWEGYEFALQEYYNTIVKTWVGRGFNNNMKLFDLPKIYDYPKWLGNEEFHASHRSNLLRKDREFYSQYKWKETDNLEYVWPIKINMER